MVARIAANMTRDSSLVPSPGTSVYWSGSIPLAVCLIILASPSIELCKAHAILTAVPGYIKNSVKKFH